MLRNFACELGTAIATVGGLITGIQLIMKTISIAVMWIYSKSGSLMCSICLTVTHVVMVFLIFVGSFVIITLLVEFKLVTLTIGGWIKAMLYVLTLCTAISIPWCCIQPRKESEDYKGTNYY